VLALRNNRLKPEIEVDGEDDGADTALGKFLEPLRKYHRLEVLDLSSNELGPAGARMVSAALMPNKSVTSLDVSDNALGLQGLDFLGKLLAGNATLQTLHCQRNQVTWNKKSKKATKAAFEIFANFATALSGNSTLSELNMAGHHFGVDVCDTLFEGFEKSRVATLTFDSNNLCGEPDVEFPDTRALEKIIAATKRAEHPLRVIRLASNRLLAGGAALLAECVVPDVEELDLRRNRIGDEGCKALCDAICKPDEHGRTCGLRTLKLAYNAIRDARPIAAALEAVQGLRSLDLGHNAVGADAEAFAMLLGSVGNGALLRELNLESNGLGAVPEQIDAVDDLFKRAKPPLAKVDLYDNPAVTLKDSLRLIAALHDNTSIKTVRISSQAGDRYQLADAVGKLLDANKTLTDVDLCFPADLDDDELVASIRHRLVVNAITGVVDVSL
jgi:Ran GTPase-activating protein (RanGAP) involved in mRNA processing and transport